MVVAGCFDEGIEYYRIDSERQERSRIIRELDEGDCAGATRSSRRRARTTSPAHSGHLLVMLRAGLA
jgi:hypothetical protein